MYSFYGMWTHLFLLLHLCQKGKYCIFGEILISYLCFIAWLNKLSFWIFSLSASLAQRVLDLLMENWVTGLILQGFIKVYVMCFLSPLICPRQRTFHIHMPHVFCIYIYHNISEKIIFQVENAHLTEFSHLVKQLHKSSILTLFSLIMLNLMLGKQNIQVVITIA